MSAEEIIARLTALARGSIRNFVQLDALGQPTICLKGASDGQLYALSDAQAWRGKLPCTPRL